MKKVFLFSLCVLACKLASADAISDAQNMASFYKGSLQLDSRNPAATYFETVIPNQLVNLKLVAKPLNTAFVTELSAPIMTRFREAASLKILDSAQIVATKFSNFEILIDGCNVSSQVVALCNAANCWLNNPTTAHPIPPSDGTGSLGSDFSMSTPVNLNAIDYTQCPAETFSGFGNDKKYIVEFREVPLDVCPTSPTGGRVDFEISVLNQTSSSRKGK